MSTPHVTMALSSSTMIRAGNAVTPKTTRKMPALNIPMPIDVSVALRRRITAR
ncbi:MAG TPA: hypothetical protein VMM78_12095 [Thermomicrobiales bacterium]|nr:hypothetical protein [Thermomicrobiales bacterium]